MQGQKKIMLKKKKRNGLTKIPTNTLKNERDFLNAITKKLKNSKQCQLCSSLVLVEKTTYLCNNFEAIWYHRDTGFRFFPNCSYFKIKAKK